MPIKICKGKLRHRAVVNLLCSDVFGSHFPAALFLEFMILRVS